MDLLSNYASTTYLCLQFEDPPQPRHMVATRVLHSLRMLVSTIQNTTRRSCDLRSAYQGLTYIRVEASRVNGATQLGICYL
jgi:hypothetical protein